ncbi:hypothetical protein B9Z55_008869 [Caenorhabditis nigoni]|uniref:Uncharacterized protein n=1 Tax=Caenorhabditis nigoni TaxID=1611254 RepID=A0A2G5UPU0_9PELO|nr:hypothetical protein B9Z55_008869 [Caenorhabditis nigoni]
MFQNQMEHIQESGWHETTPTSFPSATETNQITELRQQIAHWKQKAENLENSGIPDENSEKMIEISEMERRIEALRQQKEHEIQSIVESHAESMVEMREMYEEKISNMQVRFWLKNHENGQKTAENGPETLKKRTKIAENRQKITANSSKSAEKCLKTAENNPKLL